MDFNAGGERMNLYKIMGFEWLLDDNVWDELDKYIDENTRFVKPGYNYNYRLCSLPCHIEFHRCELLDRTKVKTDMHFCSDNHWVLEVCDVISTDSTTHWYTFKGKNGESFPARIVCPDVFPSVKKGDIIDGQIVAFADKISKMSDGATSDGGIYAENDECVVFNGVIVDALDREFSFHDNKSIFWELDVKTENGCISVLCAKNTIDFKPEIGDSISVHAIISMDVALGCENREDAEFYVNMYQGLLADTEVTYKNGFVPNFHDNQKAFINSIETGDLSRFVRCCEKEITFVSNKDIETILRNIDKKKIVDALKASLPEHVDRVEVLHFLTCKVEEFVGHDAIAVYSNNELKLAIWFDICEKGTIDEIQFFSPEDCTLGIDHELHLNAMFAHAICDSKWYILHEYMTKGCMYRSEYSDICVVGAKRIIDRFKDINSRLNHSSRYSYKLSYSKDELRQTEDLPPAYQCERCIINYQFSKLAYIIFLTINNDGKISNILLSRNPKYLKSFENDNNPNIENRSIIETLSAVYGNENTVEQMRKNEIPDEDINDIYVWKKADEFAVSWLKDNGYKMSETVLVDDCIGYACERKGTSYAVFFYAYGKEKTTLLDGDYCAKLRKENIAQGKEILIIYLHVDKKINDQGIIEYTVCGYGGCDKKIEPWLLTTVKDKNILQFYPRKEIIDCIPRLIAAYNTKNLDALKTMCSTDVYLEYDNNDRRSVNDGFYSHISHLREEYGKMKLAYIRFSDVVFSAVPYIDNYAYFSFSMGDKIDRVQQNDLNLKYRELLICDEYIDYCSTDDVPKLASVEFMPPTDVSRFSLRLTFENGEIKRYNLNGDFSDEEVVLYQRKVMTDKIFSNGRISDHIPKPDWIGYRNYAERGQGVEFITGSAISVIELYHNSYPIEKFSYAGMDDVHVIQYDYDKDGFGVGRIYNLDPQNPYYLLDSNTMTATPLPHEYQDTPISVYPFLGGYSEGLVMVSKFGELDLQYHHNRYSCAGLWGWIDRNFNAVIEPKYVYAMNFVNGRAIVCKGDWDVKISEDGKEQYWCENEQWGVIDKNENEIVPCSFDEVYEIENTDRLYFVHEGGWKNGHYAVYDIDDNEIILVLDFDFDMGYMFNECFVNDNDVLVFDKHLPGEEKDLIYAYDLINKRYIAYEQPVEGRTFNGETKSVVNRDGEEIIVF